MIAAYLVGEPGVGKSALMEYVLARFLPRPVLCRHGEFTYRDYGSGIVVAGRADPAFPGTDTLSYRAITWLESLLVEVHPAIFLAEGDRLANDRCFGLLGQSADAFTVVSLTASPAVLTARRAARGSHQATPWLAGRATKLANLTDRWSSAVVRYDTDTLDVVSLAERLTAEVPAFAALVTGKP